MSTFNGLIKEFPNIRIDYFRRHPGRPPPDACFLSHVHSDHLSGLESVKMPFVYCSATTRRLLLQIEKHPHRVKFAQGIFEARIRYYRHLQSVLRALPLQTAAELELGPKSRIRVTLLDSNHCPGAVMFLIEGDGKAVLYTGDVRAESWWVNSIVQNPVILPYAGGPQCLDCVYLDTTFASRDEASGEFPTKADGLRELLQKIKSYAADTIFHLRAWTLGYENVWLALANFLPSRVHVDDYQLRLFGSLVEGGRDGYTMFEGPALVGFSIGNHEHDGCLTRDTNVRLHSCEPGTPCYAELSQNENVVWITPIVSRLKDGSELRELGAGGGDLYPITDPEINDAPALQALESVHADFIKDEDPLFHFRDRIRRLPQSDGMPLEGHSEEMEISSPDHRTPLSKKRQWSQAFHGTDDDSCQEQKQKSTIDFPYARHSSYHELRYLISTFRPKDICPCTVALDSWSEDVSMESLFGDLCSASIFHHDVEVRMQAQQRWEREEWDSSRHAESVSSQGEQDEMAGEEGDRSSSSDAKGHEKNMSPPSLPLLALDSQPQNHTARDKDGWTDIHLKRPMTGESDRERRTLTRARAKLEAYKAATLCLRKSDSSAWDDLGLRSIGQKDHTGEEVQL